jgi:hypothetical protein
MVSSSGIGRGPTPPLPRPQTTASQRKQQLAQLAEMGVAIPDEFRPDMAMAGEWQVMAEHIIEQDGERKPEALALGVRKREPGAEDEEDGDVKKRRWGSAYRAHPAEEQDGDLDALLRNVKRKRDTPVVKGTVKSEIADSKTAVKTEAQSEDENSQLSGDAFSDQVGQIESKNPDIKHEPVETVASIRSGVPPLDTVTKQEEAAPGSGIVFKKRKAKNIRQK